MEAWLKTAFEYLYIAILASILAIRTVVSYFLVKEIEKFNISE